MSEFIKRSVNEEENLPNGTLIHQFSIPLNCATKKTSQDIIFVNKKPKIISSKRFREYETHSKPFLEDVRKNKGLVPIDFGVAIKLKVYRSAWNRIDQNGIMQCFGDILQKWGVLADDRWINWIGSIEEHWFCGIDKENPRTEVYIYRCRHPYEDFRNLQESEEERLFIKRGGPRAPKIVKKTTSVKKPKKKRTIKRKTK